MSSRSLHAGVALSVILSGAIRSVAATSNPPPASQQAGSSPAATAEALPSAGAPPALVKLRHGVFRYESYPAAWTAAQSSGRPILVFVTSRSCPHCSKMIDETYQRRAVQQFVCESFETVFVDRAEQPELAAKLKVRWYPTTMVVGPNNKVIDVIEGYVDSAAFARRLQTSLASHAATTQTR